MSLALEWCGEGAPRHQEYVHTWVTPKLGEQRLMIKPWAPAHKGAGLLSLDEGGKSEPGGEQTRAL